MATFDETLSQVIAAVGSRTQIVVEETLKQSRRAGSEWERRLLKYITHVLLAYEMHGELLGSLNQQHRRTAPDDCLEAKETQTIALSDLPTMSNPIFSSVIEADQDVSSTIDRIISEMNAELKKYDDFRTSLHELNTKTLQYFISEAGKAYLQILVTSEDSVLLLAIKEYGKLLFKVLAHLEVIVDFVEASRKIYDAASPTPVPETVATQNEEEREQALSKLDRIEKRIFEFCMIMHAQNKVMKGISPGEVTLDNLSDKYEDALSKSAKEVAVRLVAVSRSVFRQS